MCLVLFSFELHDRYRLVLASNRDEFMDRPSRPAAPWPGKEHIVAGKDLRAGGAWLGVSPGGRFATVTNYRNPGAEKYRARSRGQLVRDFLAEPLDATAYLNRVREAQTDYNGFNLLLGDDRGMWWYSNVRDEIHAVEPGLHGLSNHLLDTPWPKVERGKARFAELLDRGTIAPGDVFDMLRDETEAPDDLLPDTGVGIEWERRLSPMFVRTPGYGTRCSNLLLIDYDGRIEFHERTYPVDGAEPYDASFELASGVWSPGSGSLGGRESGSPGSGSLGGGELGQTFESE